MVNQIALKPIDFDIEILGYGPNLDLSKEGYEDLTPQQVIAFSSMMTYKSKNAKEMAIEVLKSEQDLDQKVINSIINSAGRGHASLSTSAALWCLFTGSSKYVDSLFTGAIFSSSLMPSSRRIPVNIESILTPESVIKSSPEIQKIYYETSKSNIEFFEYLVTQGVKLEEAAKITQYGITGGGFIFLPLETIIAYKKEFELEKDFVPKEGFDFISKIEAQLKELGMDILYWSRNFAPRNTLPYPNVFTDPKKNSFINDFKKMNFFQEKPRVFRDYFYETKNFENELINLYSLEQEIKSKPELVLEKWPDLLNLRRDIEKRYSNVISFSLFSNISFRVWGEAKRHRTLEQSVESVYHATEGTKEKFYAHKELIRKGQINNSAIEDLSKVYIMPESIKKDRDLTIGWLRHVLDSLEAYDKLKETIPISDAFSVIPRGIKLSIFKRFDLYNILDGYIPLRLCGTAEPEMRRITELERDLIKDNSPGYLNNLIGPKCQSVGYCLEPYKSYCGRINPNIGFQYTEDFHKLVQTARVNLIKEKLK